MSQELLLKSVQRLANALARLERKTAAETGVSVAQFRILLCLVHQAPEAGLRVSDLAEDQGVAVSTMTRNVALLEKRAWVVRETGPNDRRTVQVRLTPEGRVRSKALRESSLGTFNRAFRAFHPSDRVERAVALNRVAAALEGVEPKG